MTDNEQRGPHQAGPHQPQPQTWPPQPPHLPPPAGQWTPADPYRTPPPTPPRRARGPLIIGAVVIVVIAFVATIVLVTREPSTPSTTATAIPSSLPPNAKPTAPFYMLADPANAIPTTDEVKQATLMDLTPNGTPRTTSLPDHPTKPPACSLAASSTTQTMWGEATQLAGQQFIDPNGSNNRAWAGVAFWSTDQQAQASLDRLTAAIQGCSAFTLLGVPPDPDTQWTTSDIHRGDHRIGFTTTLVRENGAKPWKCIQDYHVAANVAVTASMCSTNPSSSAAALSDTVLNKATKH